MSVKASGTFALHFWLGIRAYFLTRTVTSTSYIIDAEAFANYEGSEREVWDDPTRTDKWQSGDGNFYFWGLWDEEIVRRFG